MVMKNELNALLLICSDELKIKIKEHRELTEDFFYESQRCLNYILPKDGNVNYNEIQTFGQNNKWVRFQSLNEEILELMRIEISYDGKKRKHPKV